MTTAPDVSTALEFPTVDGRSERSLATLARGTIVQAERLLSGWARDPATTAQAMLYPALTLVMLRIVIGNTVAIVTGQPAVYGMVPMITLIAAMSGATVSGIGLNNERKTGLLSRFATLPIHRAAGLTGRLLAEAVRIAVTTIFVIGVGVCLGFRFAEGPAAGLALICLPIVFGTAFAVLVTTLAALARGILAIMIVNFVNILLMYFNSGFVPVFAYPVWLQSTVANQPMSCAIDAMRALAVGGPIAEPLYKTIAWSLGTVVVFAYPTVRALRHAAEHA